MKNCISGITLIALVFLLEFSGVAQQYTWKQKADYGGGEVFNPLWLVIYDYAYIGTGRSLPASNRIDFWQYDPLVNIWSQKSDFPGAGRYGAVGFSIGPFGYAGSGWTPSPVNDFYRYSPFTNSWQQIASFPGQARYTATSFSVGGFGFVGLGYSPCMSDFWKYDPSTDSWSQSANYPGGTRQSVVSFVIDSSAFVGTGLCTGTVYNNFYKYNYITNSWTPIASLPTSGRTAGYGFSINGKGYHLMGCDYLNNSQIFNIYNDLWEYDPIADEWTQLPDFPGKNRFHGAAFSINNKGYLGLGSDTTIFNTHYLADFWEYSPDSSTGVHDLEVSYENISIYPVPTKDLIVVQFNSGNNFQAGDRITIYSSAGKEVFSTDIAVGESKIKLDVSDFSSGIYHCRLMRNKKPLATKKFVKYK